MTNGYARAGAVAALLFPLLALGAAPSPLESLVTAERDFARLCVARGLRVSFDAFFADDGIWFAPHPEKVREALARQPATTPTSTLDWFPTRSDVSAAGDLGYNTGPFVVREVAGDRKVTQRGWFFSVWKRQADGAWKVAVDFGTGGVDVAGAPVEAAQEWRAARAERWTGVADVVAARDSLRARERELARDVAAKGLAAAYAGSLSEDFRVYRLHERPFVDGAVLSRRLASEERLGRLAWEVTAVDVARSADFAYTWGGYEWTREGAAAETGYYVHVWRRGAAGCWHLAVEATRPAPSPAPVRNPS